MPVVVGLRVILAVKVGKGVVVGRGVGVSVGIGEGVNVEVGGIADNIATCKVCVISGVGVLIGGFKNARPINRTAPIETISKQQAITQ